MNKTIEIFITLLETHLKERIAIRALVQLKEKYPKLELDFIKLGDKNQYIMYDRVNILVSDDKTMDVESIQIDYDTFYQNQLVLELDKTIKKIIE